MGHALKYEKCILLSSISSQPTSDAVNFGALYTCSIASSCGKFLAQKLTVLKPCQGICY